MTVIKDQQHEFWVFGVSTERLNVILGDASLPLAPLAGGSQLANVLVGAVHKAALNLKSALLRLATEANQSPLLHTRIEDLVIREGQIRLKRRPASGLDLVALMTLSGHETVEASGDTFGENATAQDRFQAGRTFKQMIAPTIEGAFSSCVERSIRRGQGR